jgi:hypothetical protein
VIDLLIWTIMLIPLDVTASPVPVYPSRSSGMAASLIGGFFGLGLVVLAAILLGTKPRRARPPRL